MITLHIEHAISDYPAWRAAFDRFAGARREAGVLGARVAVPLDDPQHIVIDLDFDSQEQARSFLDFLRTTVWSTSANSPALAGAPEAVILRRFAVDV